MTNGQDIRTELKVVVVTVPMQDSIYNTELAAVMLAMEENPGWWAYDCDWLDRRPATTVESLPRQLRFSVALEPQRHS